MCGGVGWLAWRWYGGGRVQYVVEVDGWSPDTKMSCYVSSEGHDRGLMLLLMMTLLRFCVIL